MATATGAVEEAIREYLLFRGYVDTLKVFEEERRGAKEKEYKATHIVKHLLACVYNSDLQELRKFWSLLSQKLFSRLASDFKQTLYKLETYLLRLYLVHAKMSGRVDAIRTFFETMSDTLALRKEWKEWFAFPYSTAAEQHPTFGVYFTREWILTFRVSLKNFFDTVFTYLPKPMLLNFQSEHNKVQALATESRLLHNQLAESKASLAAAESRIQQQELRFMQLTLNVGSAEAKGGASPVRKVSVNVKPKRIDDFSFKRAQSMGSADKPAKKAVVPQSQPTNGQPRVTSPPKPSTEPSTASQPPLKNLSDGVKNVKLYPSSSGRTSFFVVQQVPYKGHSSPVVQAKFSANGEQIASLDASNIVKIWDSKQPHGTTSAAQTKSSIVSIEWLPIQDNLIMLGMSDGKVKMLNTQSATFTTELDCGHEYNQVLSLVHKPNSNKVACFAMAGEKEKSGSYGLVSPNLPSSKHVEMQTKTLSSIILWDLATGTKDVFDPLSVVINSLSFTNNGTLLVTGASDGYIRLFDVHRKELLEKWKAHNGQVFNVRYSADESGIFSFGEDNVVVQWSILKAGEQLSSISTDAVESLSYPASFSGAFALDMEGKNILIRGKNDAALYSLQQGHKTSLTARLFGHSSRLTAVDWTGIRNLNTCITASLDATVRVTTLLRQ